MTLYRKHRPATFSNLIGQNQAKTILQQAITRKRIAHAYLFSGPRGTGKTSAARIFARAICCEKPQESQDGIEACGVCSNCVAMLQNHTPDFIEIDAASNRGIEEMRTLREQAQYGPIQLPRKIYIIDEVHMLTNEAFNALLKTLEEPPDHCIFILATTDIHKLPATVRSRCLLIRFERASAESIILKLQAIIKKDTLTVDASALPLIAAAADGGFRDAETILEQLTTQFSHVTQELTEQTLGTISANYLVELLQATLAGDTHQVSTILRKYFSSPELRYAWVIQELIQLVRQQPEPSAQELTFLEHLLEAYILQKSSPVPSLPLEIACLSTAHSIKNPKKSPEIQPPAVHQIVAPIRQQHEQKIEQKVEQKTVAAKITPIIQAPAVSSVPVVELRETTAPSQASVDIRKAWKQCCEAIAVVSFPLSQLLQQAVLHTAEAQLITLHVKYRFHADKLGEKKNIHLVQDKLKEITGLSWSITYIVNQSLPKSEAKNRITPGTNSDINPSNVAEVFKPVSK